jgi:hypothetical protein
MSLAMDPSEYPGTPEYEELQAEREARYTQFLDEQSEEQDYECIQYPQRFSH